MWVLKFTSFDMSCNAEVCGTPGYLAPEIIECSMDAGHAGYDTAVDMWVCIDNNKQCQCTNSAAKWIYCAVYFQDIFRQDIMRIMNVHTVNFELDFLLVCACRWSSGVIMYTLLAGSPPFWHRKQMMMLRMILGGTYDFSSPEWEDRSDTVKDLVGSFFSPLLLLG